MNDDNVKPPTRDIEADSKKPVDKQNQTREERLREELRKNLRKRKGQKI